MVPHMVTAAVQALERLVELGRSGQLDEVCDRHGIDLVVAFGRTVDAHDVNAVPRDLDVAVRFGAGTDPDAVAVVHDLQRLLRFDAVDLLVLDRAGIVAADQALRTGQPLYERRQGMFADRQMAAMTMRMDTAWLRQLQLELLAG